MRHPQELLVEHNRLRKKYRRLKGRHEKLLALFRDMLKVNVRYVDGLNENLVEAEGLLATKKKKAES